MPHPTKSAAALVSMLCLSLPAAQLGGCASDGPHGGDAFVRSASLPAAENLDFEAGAGPDGLPAGWYGGGPGYAITVETAQARTGKGAAHLAWNMPKPPTEDDWCTLTQCLDVEAWKGKRIRFTGFLKTSQVTRGSGIWMRVDRNKECVAFDNMDDRGQGHERLDPMRLWSWMSPRIATRVCFGVLLVGPGRRVGRRSEV